MSHDLVFIDTNIWVYAYSETELSKQHIVQSLLRPETTRLSTQVINELVWVLIRKYKVQVSLVQQLQMRLCQNFQVANINTTTITSALDIVKKHNISYWDALMVTSAKEQHCKTFLTEDLNHGQLIAGVRIQNPFS